MKTIPYESRDMSHGNQSEEIRRLEQELRDARKQIEILSRYDSYL